jgi:transposase
LIALAAERPTWLLGYQDETWWSRVARPALMAWAEPMRPLRLTEVAVSDDDPAPKALACYGLWLPDQDEMWLRFVDGRPVSALTIAYLTWCAEQAAARAKTTLVLIWDNAGWHSSHRVRDWLRQHNQTVARTGQGVRLIPCWLPSRSPWLNPIEPKWGHGKRRVIEPDRVLSPDELEDWICHVFKCPRSAHLSLSNDVD